MSYNKETGLWEGFIYKIINDVNDKVYIGQTITTIKERWWQHKYSVKKHSPNDFLHNAMEKYGFEKFNIEIIENVYKNTKKDLKIILDEKEKFYINKFNSNDRNFGYNITPGGQSGERGLKRNIKQYSLDGIFIETHKFISTIEKIADTMHVIHDCCNGKIKYAYGYIWRYEDDAVDKYSLPTEREKKSAIIRANFDCKIIKYDFYGNKKFTYKDIDDAAIKENVSRRDIINCCNGRIVYINNHIFRFENDDFDKYQIFRKNNKITLQYALNGNLLYVYNNATEASAITGISIGSICNVCNGRNKTAGGYIWRYVENIFEIPDLSNSTMQKQVYQYNREGILLNIFKNETEAALNTGINSSYISEVCNGKIIPYFSLYVWSFHELTKEDIDNILKHPNCKGVYQYDRNGVLLNYFYSVTEASKYSGIDRSSIARLSKAKTLSPFTKYAWSYVELSKEDVLKKFNSYKNTSKVAVCQYDMNDNFIEMFGSYKDAGVQFNAVKAHEEISKCCRYKKTSYKNFKWFLATDPNQPGKSKIIV